MWDFLRLVLCSFWIGERKWKKNCSFKSQICPLCQSSPIGGQIWHPWSAHVDRLGGVSHDGRMTLWSIMSYLGQNRTNPVKIKIKIKISVPFGSTSQNVLKSDRKMSRISPIWCQSGLLWEQICHPWSMTQNRLD